MKQRSTEFPDKIEILGCIAMVRYSHNVPTTLISSYGVKKLRHNPPGGKAFVTLPETLIPRWHELKEIEPPFFGEGWDVEAGFKNSLTHPWDQIVEEARLIDSDHRKKWSSHCEKKPEIMEQQKEFWLEDKDADSFLLPAPVEEVYGTDRKRNPLVAILQFEWLDQNDKGFLFEARWYLNRFEAEADRRRAQEIVESARKLHCRHLVMEKMVLPNQYDLTAEFPKPQRFDDGWIALVENYDARWQSFIGFRVEYFRNNFDDENLLEEVVMVQWKKAKARYEGPRTCRMAIEMVLEHLQSRNQEAAKKFSGMFAPIKEGKLDPDQCAYGGDSHNTNFYSAGSKEEGGWSMSFKLAETRLVEWQFGSDPDTDIDAIRGALEEGILNESLII